MASNAQNAQIAKKSFYEVVFRGKPKVVRAFLAGLVAGADYTAEIYFSFEAGIHHEGKIEHLREMLHVRALDCHVVVDAETSSRLKKLARGLPGTTGLEITSHRHIRNASLEYCYETFARRYDEDILAVFENRPPGLRLKDQERKLHKDPQARGVEAYAPAHHYEASGHGTVVGPVDQVIAFKKTLDGVPLIQAKDIVLNLA